MHNGFLCCLGFFSVVRLLLYVCQVTLSTLYNKCRCCFVFLNPCACCGVKFLSLSSAVHSRSGEELSVRIVTLPGWACTWTSHAQKREAWPLPISCFPVIWQKWGTSSLPDMSQESGPCRGLCAILIPKDHLMYVKTRNAVTCCYDGCWQYLIWPLFPKFHLCSIEWARAGLRLWVNELWASASGEQPGCLHD